MNAEPFTVVARVAKTHGLNGEVSVVPATEAPLSLLEGLECWFTPPPPAQRVSKLLAVRPGPKRSLARFEGVDTIDQARALMGAQVLMRTDRLPVAWTETAEEEDCTGYSVTDVVHGPLGIISETLVTGANDVWIVHGPLGEVLIPVIEQVVLDIDDDDQTVSVKLLEGLLPGEADEA